MTVQTTTLDAFAHDHLNARSAQDKASQTEVKILTNVAEVINEPADIQSYLLAFETEYKRKAFNADSLKTIKTNIKAFLEFANGWRKGQETWTPEQVASEAKRVTGEAKSLQQLAKGARESVKDASTADAGKDDLNPQAPTVDQMTAKIAKLTNSFAEAGATKAEIIQALEGLIKLAKSAK